MDGGLIQNIEVTNDLKDIEITVIDYDTEGIDESDLVTISGYPAKIYQHTFSPGDVEFFEDVIKKRDKSPMTKKQVFKQIKEIVGEFDLDEEVHEFKSLEASKINNEGINAQLEYLEKEAGLDWLIETYLK